MVKIGAELPKLYQNKTGYPFFWPPCTCHLLSAEVQHVANSNIHTKAADKTLELS